MSVDDLLHHAVVFMDAKSAHDYARRSRYHIPQWWEWIIVGGVVLAVFAEGARLFIGDAGLLSLLRR